MNTSRLDPSRIRHRIVESPFFQTAPDTSSPTDLSSAVLHALAALQSLDSSQRYVASPDLLQASARLTAATQDLVMNREPRPSERVEPTQTDVPVPVESLEQEPERKSRTAQHIPPESSVLPRLLR